MSRLIEIDKALQAVDKRIEELYKMEVFRKKADNIDVLGVKKWINNIPTIYAIPIDRIEQARKEIEFANDTTYGNYKKIVLSILDKLIAESED